MDHEDGLWCWCRPRVIDNGVLVTILHRDIDPSVLSVRLLHGGPQEESNGDAAVWINENTD